MKEITGVLQTGLKIIKILLTEPHTVKEIGAIIGRHEQVVYRYIKVLDEFFTLRWVRRNGQKRGSPKYYWID